MYLYTACLSGRYVVSDPLRDEFGHVQLPCKMCLLTFSPPAQLRLTFRPDVRLALPCVTHVFVMSGADMCA